MFSGEQGSSERNRLDLCLVPDQGFQRNRLQSLKAIRWLEWVRANRNIDIVHRSNGSEKKIGSFYVDGFCE